MWTIEGNISTVDNYNKNLTFETLNINKMNSQSIAKELEQLPNNLKQEVFDFIAFLKSKKISSSKNKTPKFGSLKGKIKMHPNFDEPMQEFNEYV